jgi:hypothetical protein
MERRMKVNIVLRDSLGHVVTERDTTLSVERVERIKRKSEYLSEYGCYSEEIIMDDEYATKEYYF